LIYVSNKILPDERSFVWSKNFSNIDYLKIDLKWIKKGEENEVSVLHMILFQN